jgi:hypothetical protein
MSNPKPAQKPNPQWPSKTGKPSGGNRGINPPKPKKQQKTISFTFQKPLLLQTFQKNTVTVFEIVFQKLFFCRHKLIPSKQ